jgi:hypothetical protein
LTRKLFLDDVEIESLHGLSRELGHPDKHPNNPVLRCERPWEMLGVQTYGTVIHDVDEGLFKIWYLTHAGPSDETVMVDGIERLANMTLLGYATSRDGLTWDRPALGQVDFEGSRENNILRIGNVNVEGASILLQPREEDPSSKYKAFYWEHGSGEVTHLDDGTPIWGEGEGDGMWVSFSEDGVHWNNHPDNPVIAMGSDTGQSVVWDPGIHRYVAFGRFGAGGRKVARSESPDFVHWSEPELVLQPDGIDGSNTQFYGISVTLYEGLYIGLLWIFHIEPKGHLGGGRDVGSIDIQLVSSRDGREWNRVCDREVFMPNGPEGEWDSRIIQAACRFVTLEDRHLVFYNGTSCRHGKGGRRGNSQIGMASLRRDGFVYIAAGEEEGTLVTRGFIRPPGDLHVNVNAKGGNLTVEYVDFSSKPSLPMTTDSMNLKVPWAEGNATPDEGEIIKLRFRIRNSKLYSYWFE